MHASIEFTGVFIKSESGEGYMAYLDELPEVATEGETVDEAAQNLVSLLPDVLQVKREIAAEQRLINGEDDHFITRPLSYTPIL